MTSKIAAYGAKKILGPELTKYANKKVSGDYVSLFRSLYRVASHRIASNEMTF
jgi:hypothetical protein